MATKKIGIVAIVARACAVITATTAVALVTPPTAEASTRYAAVAWSASSDWTWAYNYKSQTDLILGLQDRGWSNYQVISSGQCASLVRYRGESGVTPFSGHVSGVAKTRDAATNKALRAANSRVVGLGGSTRVLTSWCQD